MTVPKHVLSILILSTFFMVVVQALVEDNGYKLGYGRIFAGFYWSGVDYLGHVNNVELEDCCQACKTKAWPAGMGAHPDTEAFTFKNKENSPSRPRNSCTCLKRKTAGGQWPATKRKGYWSGLCGQNSLDVDGAIGEGRLFYNDSHQTTIELGSPNANYVHVKNKDECCEKCAEAHPTTQMYDFDEYLKYCICHESLPGVRPVTSEFIDYVGMCGCNEKPHGISCCSAGFTPGDNVAKGEMFIQAEQYVSTCVDTCKSLYPNSTGVTESVKQKYSSGNGRNKNKCWCEMSQEPELNFGNLDYQTCVFV